MYHPGEPSCWLIKIQAAYLLKSAARPETIPACLTTMRFIQTTNRNFTTALWTISYQAKSIGEQFHRVRQLYEIHEIRNKVPDGTTSFPEDSRSLASGITVEFRYALRALFPFAFRTAEFFFVHIETSPSAIPARKISRSAMCRLKLKKDNFASVNILNPQFSEYT